MKGTQKKTPQPQKNKVPTNFMNAQINVNQMGNLYGNLDQPIASTKQQQQLPQQQQKQSSTNQKPQQQQIQAKLPQSQTMGKAQISINQIGSLYSDLESGSGNIQAQQQQQKQQNQQFQQGKLEIQQNDLGEKNYSIGTQEQIQIEQFKLERKVLKIQSALDLERNILGKKYRQKYIQDLEKDDLSISCWNKMVEGIFNDDVNLPIFNMSEDFQIKKQFEPEIKKPFFDTEFNLELQQIKPAKAAEIFSKEGFCIFSSEVPLQQAINPQSVVQGELGNCYFVSAISILAEKPQFIQRLFNLNQCDQKNSFYQIFICESGAWKIINVDDFFPSRNGYLIFAKGTLNQIWVPLLEKAYAKNYGSYYQIQVGYSMDALKDLTGAPTEYIELKDELKAFKEMKENLSRGFVLTASSKEDSEVLVSFHSYCILDLKELQGHRFIKIRNPHGISMNNINFTENEQKILGEEKRQKGGINWMTLKEFKENFEVVTCCRIQENYFYSFYETQKNQRVYLVKTFAEENHVYFSIHQTHEKFFKKDIKKDKYLYQTQRIIVAKINEKSDEIEVVLGGNFNSKQSCFQEFQLKKGTYIVWAEVDQKTHFTVSTYSKEPLCLAPLNQFYKEENLEQFQEKLVRKYLFQSQIESEKKIYQENIFRRHGPLFGFVYIFYQNNSLNTTLFETIEEFPVFENLISFKGSATKNQKIEVAPKNSHLILFKIGNNNNCSHKLAFKTKFNLLSQKNNEELEQEALNKGNKKPKTQDNLVVSYSLKYEKGFFIQYFNQSNKNFHEELTFKQLNNLEIQTQNNLKNNNTVTIKLAPQEKFWIKLNFKDPSNTASSYSLNSLIIQYK